MIVQCNWLYLFFQLLPVHFTIFMYALLEPGDSLRQKSFSVTIEGALAGLVSVMPGHELRN